jgi:hypothetical protein
VHYMVSMQHSSYRDPTNTGSFFEVGALTLNWNFFCSYATREEADWRANLVPASCWGESSMYCTPAQYFMTSHLVSASAEGLSLIEEQDGGSPVVYYLTKSWVGNRS